MIIVGKDEEVPVPFGVELEKGAHPVVGLDAAGERELLLVRGLQGQPEAGVSLIPIVDRWLIRVSLVEQRFRNRVAEHARQALLRTPVAERAVEPELVLDNRSADTNPGVVDMLSHVRLGHEAVSQRIVQVLLGLHGVVHELDEDIAGKGVSARSRDHVDVEPPALSLSTSPPLVSMTISAAVLVLKMYRWAVATR